MRERFNWEGAWIALLAMIAFGLIVFGLIVLFSMLQRDFGLWGVVPVATVLFLGFIFVMGGLSDA